MKTLLALFCLLPTLCFSQGFGSFKNDQPFLAKDIVSGGGGLVPPDLVGLAYWWHGGDVGTNELATNWVDRVQGNVFESSAANAPTNTDGVYIRFSGAQYMTNSTELSSLEPINPSVHAYIIARGGDFEAIMSQLGAPTRDGIIGGIGTRPNSGGVDQNVCDMPPIGTATDYVIQGTGNGNSGWGYTNGVAGRFTNNLYGPIVSKYILGKYASGGTEAHKSKAKLYDIFIYTNVTWSPANLATFHTWATNHYPSDITP